jgi:hypothetical protein
MSNARGLAQRKNFGVRSGVNEGDGLIVGSCHNPGADHGDCPHWNLSFLGAFARFLKGNRHVIQVI